MDSLDLKRAAMAPLANYLRLWDFASAARVDEFVANSENVQRRIWRCYRRESEVIYPPVAVEKFYSKPSEDYYLVVSELVAYKRIETAVRLFSKTGRKLRVVGDGPEYKNLKSMATPNVEFPRANLRRRATAINMRGAGPSSCRGKRISASRRSRRWRAARR